jgi:hypothetical protein
MIFAKFKIHDLIDDLLHLYSTGQQWPSGTTGIHPFTSDEH